jgi:cardiolipin synthase (CMP-forming)
MPSFFLFLIAGAILCPSISLGSERGSIVVFETEGIAAVIGFDLARARDAAIQDALQKAVAKAVEKWLTPQRTEQNFTLLKVRIYDRAEEFTQDYRILFEISDPDIYSVTVRATVFSDSIRKELQDSGLIKTTVQNPFVTRMILTVRGIRTYGEFSRLRILLKEKIPGIREVVPREAAWGIARFDISGEGTIATMAERLREKLAIKILYQDDQTLELHLIWSVFNEMTPNRLRRLLSLRLLLLVVLAGCAAKIPHQIMSDFNQRGIRSIAIMPIDNSSADPKSAEMLRAKLAEEIYFKAYRPVPLRIVDEKLRGLSFAGSREKVSSQQIGEMLKVDAILYSTLIECRMGSSSLYASTVAEAEFELFSAKTGESLWRVRHRETYRNYGFTRTQVELKSSLIYEQAIHEMITRALETLPDGPEGPLVPDQWICKDGESGCIESGGVTTDDTGGYRGMNIPNLLTLLRIILVPVVVILLIQEMFLKALIAFVIAGLSDILDGFFARVLNQQTALGAYMDPIADKALLTSSFITLSVLHDIPGWLTVIVISRDIIILLGISILTIMSVQVRIRPTFISKITTALQLSTVLMILLDLSIPSSFDKFWYSSLQWMTALFTVVSGLDYMVKGQKLMNHEAKKWDLPWHHYIFLLDRAPFF